MAEHTYGFRVVRSKHQGRTVFVLRGVQLIGGKVDQIIGDAVAYYFAEKPDELQFLRAMDAQLCEMREALHLSPIDEITLADVMLGDEAPVPEPEAPAGPDELE